MHINNDLSIQSGDESTTLFNLLKSHLDNIIDESEFKKFQKLVDMHLSGCIEYINAVNLTDRVRLIEIHHQRLKDQRPQMKLAD